jgi:hypothetical protein
MDWSKLTSRKLWMAIAGFVSMLLISLGADANEAEQIASLIMAGAMVVAYIIGEGLVDKASAGAPTTVVSGPAE